MKKYSLSFYLILVLIVFAFTITSCSKKYGCFYSIIPEVKVESNRNPGVTPMSSYPSGVMLKISENDHACTLLMKT